MSLVYDIPSFLLFVRVSKEYPHYHVGVALVTHATIHINNSLPIQFVYFGCFETLLDSRYSLGLVKVYSVG